MKKNKTLPVHHFKAPLDDSVPIFISSYKNLSSELKADAQASFPHRHSFYEILHITGGEGTCYIDFTPYPLDQETLYFVSPGQVHFWQGKAPLEGHVILFTDDFLLLDPLGHNSIHELSLFHCLTPNPAIQLGQKQKIKTNTMINELEQEYCSTEFSRASVLRARLHLFLIEIQRCHNKSLSAGKVGKGPALARRFKQLVSKNITMEQTVRDYAGQLGITESHLRDTIKTVTGKSPGEIIRLEIISEAKRLLAHTNLNVSEICFSLHFADSSYFSRFFKRETGLSPLHFRRHIREGNGLSDE